MIGYPQGGPAVGMTRAEWDALSAVEQGNFLARLSVSDQGAFLSSAPASIVPNLITYSRSLNPGRPAKKKRSKSPPSAQEE